MHGTTGGKRFQWWPYWLNSITYQPGKEPKIYRWLWFNWWWE